MYVYYNLNPDKNIVGDCGVRAIGLLTNQDWDTTYLRIVIQGLLMHNMPSSNAVWGGRYSYGNGNMNGHMGGNNYSYDNGYSRMSPTDKMMTELQMMMDESTSSRDKAIIQRALDELKK